jgi:hypothetical protein
MAIADTGASGHYIRPQDPHKSNGTTQDRITVGLPNGATLQSSPNHCTLDIPQLPNDARKAHLIPGLTHSSLVSIGTLCDAGCKATFDRTTVVITNNDDIVMTGPRDLETTHDSHTHPRNSHNPPMRKCTTTTNRDSTHGQIFTCSIL